MIYPRNYLIVIAISSTKTIGGDTVRYHDQLSIALSRFRMTYMISAAIMPLLLLRQPRGSVFLMYAMHSSCKGLDQLIYCPWKECSRGFSV